MGARGEGRQNASHGTLVWFLLAECAAAYGNHHLRIQVDEVSMIRVNQIYSLIRYRGSNERQAKLSHWTVCVSFSAPPFSNTQNSLNIVVTNKVLIFAREANVRC